MTEQTYATDLDEYVDKQISRWSKQKKVYLEQKFQKNYEAVTNKDFRVKKWKKGEGEGWRSTTWIGHIRVKIWTLYSIFLDTVLQGGEVPFDLKPNPYGPEDMSDEYKEDRDNRITRMKKKIKGQHKIRKVDRETIKKFLSGSWYGMAFSKFDVEEVVSHEFKQVDMELGNVNEFLSPEEASKYVRFERVAETENVPGHRYVSVWNMCWDMEVDDLQAGEGYAEKIPSSLPDLENLKKKHGYINDKIKEVMEENRDTMNKSDTASMTPGQRTIKEASKKIQRYEYYMTAPRKFVEKFEETMKKRHKVKTITLGSMEDYALTEQDGDVVEIMGEIADKKIIRHIRNETGKRNHHMFMLERALDESHGTGVADNMEDVQASLVGMVRAFEDNKRISANVTTAVKKRYFSNPSQLDDIVPGKTYEISESCDDVRKAIMPIVFPDVGESLVSGIGMMERWKDDVSMIPTILQGFNLPKQKSDTAFELNQMMINSGKYIGMIISNYDEQIIEPEITDIYDYNMMYSDDESCKVNCKVVAEGFTGYRNNYARGEALQNMLGTIISNEILAPYVKITPHLEIMYEIMGEDPDDFLKSEEEMAAEQQQQAEMQAMAEQKAIQAMAIEKNLESEGKVAAIKAKTEGDIMKETIKAGHKDDQSEQDFHRDIIKESIEKPKAAK
uniref:Putative portal protein n=2 Tax=viral metagenome TaxID=1070528 RepID=A0A6H1ZKX1_9ZZZZ